MKTQQKIKYPKTPHLPWSNSISNDDISTNIYNLSLLNDVIVTEKLDGENCNMYNNHIHARSLDSKSHKSRDWVFSFHKTFSYKIPDTFRICGENIYAKHSIYYDKLSTYFYVFAIFNTATNECLSWDDTERLSKFLELETVPVLYRGPYNEDKIKSCFTGISKFGDTQEGYVIRNSNKFLLDNFQKNVAKFVRKNHVTTDQFWLSNWNKNIDINKLINHLEKKEQNVS